MVPMRVHSGAETIEDRSLAPCPTRYTTLLRRFARTASRTLTSSSGARSSSTSSSPAWIGRPMAAQEIWADGMGSCPGGIANLAVAARRLGLRTSLAAAFGDDDYGDFCWEHPGRVRSTSTSAAPAASRAGTRRSPSPWPSTATAAWSRHGHPPPIGPDRAHRAPAAGQSRDGDARRRQRPRRRRRSPTWVRAWPGDGRRPRLRRRRLGPHGALAPRRARPARGVPRLPAQRRRGDGLHRARRPRARPCTRSRDRVPLAVVTNGENGAMAIDSTTGEEAVVPGAARLGDATRPAPVTSSAPRIVLGTLADWPLQHRLAFATLCSSLSVQQFGGSLAAPGWGDIADWWARQRAGMSAGSYHAFAAAAATPSSTTSSPTCRSGSAVGRRATIARHARRGGGPAEPPPTKEPVHPRRRYPPPCCRHRRGRSARWPCRCLHARVERRRQAPQASSHCARSPPTPRSSATSR